MIDIRCPRCNSTKETLELDKKTTFSSKPSKTVCSKCKEELLNPEGGLLKAILGWEVEEDEVDAS